MSAAAPKTQYYTAATLDGFIADRHHSLDWLFQFGVEGTSDYPEFIGQAKADYEYSQTLQRGQSWRDAIGQCFPAGQPMVMTRVWPIAMVQLPTVIYMVSNFNNEFRQIFLDGRPWTDPDTVIFTYNGEAQGHFDSQRNWEWATSRIEANMAIGFAGGQGNRYPKKAPTSPTEITTDKWKFFPIPQAEIDRNPAIVQQPEWVGA